MGRVRAREDGTGAGRELAPVRALPHLRSRFACKAPRFAIRLLCSRTCFRGTPKQLRTAGYTLKEMKAATFEVKMLVCLMVQRFRFRLAGASAERVEKLVNVTLSVKGGLNVLLEER